MPEFVMDHGTREAAKRFKALDAFTQGYIEAMFFTECHADNPELEDATFEDLAAESLAAIIEECKDFQESNERNLGMAYDYAPAAYDANRAGNDFWYTRNGHGTGFWDRQFGGLRTETIGGRLSEAAEACGSRDVYRGDDGKVYV